MSLRSILGNENDNILYCIDALAVMQIKFYGKDVLIPIIYNVDRDRFMEVGTGITFAINPHNLPDGASENEKNMNKYIQILSYYNFNRKKGVSCKVENIQDFIKSCKINDIPKYASKQHQEKLKEINDFINEFFKSNNPSINLNFRCQNDILNLWGHILEGRDLRIEIDEREEYKNQIEK